LADEDAEKALEGVIVAAKRRERHVKCADIILVCVHLIVGHEIP